MSKIDRMVNNEIGVEDIFGMRADASLERKLLQDLSRLDGRSKKAADIAINMFMRLFEPDSDHATRPEHVGRPVVLAYPTKKHPETAGQVDAFVTVTKAMFQGRGLIDQLIIPYTPEITLVGHNPKLERMVVGQRIHSHLRPEQTIPEIDDAIARLNEDYEQHPDATPFIPTAASMFYLVLAHADKDGVNAQLYDQALSGYTNRMNLRHDVMQTVATAEPLDFSMKSL